MSIKLLSDETIQKIAAGEVVENPYSVIKELVENSIDSKATTIKVEIKNAGKKEIMISDNGCGINEDEIELAFTKHATSKLNKFDDIYSILSYGFRGEALSSIAAVSKVDINTRTKDSNYGTHCHLEENKVLKKNKVGMNYGTTIYIRDLFYNVPIRKKFLKSDSYENSIITTLMYSFALANQNISFKYIKDGKSIFETNEKNSLKDNIIELFDRNFFKNLIPINIKDSDYNVYGYISNNHYYKSNRSSQFLFVNGRYVYDEKIRNIVEKSLYSIIPKGKFPAFIIFVEVNPNLIDINVHPNKKKIKFIFEDKLLNLINNNILDIIFDNTKSDYIVAKENDDKLEQIYVENPSDNSDNCVIDSDVTCINITEYDDNYNTDMSEKFSYEDLFKVKSDEIFTVNETISIDKYTIDEPKKEQKSIFEEIKVDKLNAVNVENKKALKDYNLLSTLFNSFILLSDNNEFIILDIINAKRRIIYENLYSGYKNNSTNKQILLFPIILELSEYEMDKFNKIKLDLNSLGIEADVFDENSIAIRTMPSLLNDDSLDKEDVRAMINELLIENNIFEENLYRMILKKKIYLNENFTDFESKELINKLSFLDTDLNFLDKKIVRKISKEEFEKIFFKD
ncbi:MAG: DNA mismatch repair endonuclease MutL [Parvimonas sp.]|uniref:DNA mismatch repair endonuclease MutL n=1 Tax=Parvimonas sp. TaxID=1944660 RepID=UPI0025EB2820|nr:DNA mismatch repair endonuclease MutL [Parvimonas sp.]MCI5997522.1 DNA mismatch repair endonuclease MutL [Parvimonas sp.]